MENFTLISAADSGYFPRLRDLVTSIEAARGDSDLKLSILDLGLDADQVAWLEKTGATVKPTDWDYDFPGVEQMAVGFKAMTARPNLPKHFPGYDVYMWLDADIWIQDATVIDDFVRGATEFGVTITAELDPAYYSVFGDNRARRMHHGTYVEAFGQEAGDVLITHPIINSGAFAIRADSPIWEMWSTTLAGLLEKTQLKHIEQAALNGVLYSSRSPHPHFLSSLHNWVCSLAPPVVDVKTATLLHPHIPYDPIKVVHLAGAKGILDLRTLDGGRELVDISYTGMCERFGELMGGSS